MSWRNPQQPPFKRRIFKSLKPLPEWTKSLQPGDIVTNGRLKRVVREATRDAVGNLTHVCFTITRCSWTGRGTTTYTRYDFLAAGYVPTGERKKFNKRVDERVARALDYSNRAKKILTCCQVSGIL